LLEDLVGDLDYVQQRPLQSIFFGGGTPSLFSAESFERILSASKHLIGFDNDIEITLEANPGTFEQNRFAEYRAAGINRLSIGIQSFQAAMLVKLGRVHDHREALSAAEIARAAGFDNFNLDLMFGLPGQNLELAMADLKQALALQPSHISWYQLTLEPNTVFYKHPPKLPKNDLIDCIQDAGIAQLEAAAYQRYEISAFSRASKQARHNLNYWHFGDYLGIGAGAHGKITVPRQSRILRTRKIRQPKAYLAQDRVFNADTREIAESDLALEYMMNVLRLVQGADLESFESRTGLPRSSIMSRLTQLQQQKLLQAEGIVTSPKGMNLLNNVLQTFIN
jgi:putative oxygen-independent coproporphyrinogen III oxidase